MASDPSFRPAWWLRGAHAQTLWGKVRRRDPGIATRPEQWPAPDGDLLDVHRLDGPAGSPRLVILHGLEGTAASHYVRSSFDEAARRGWCAVLLLFRGCSGRLNHARRLYHSGETTDLDHVVRTLLREEPGAPIVLAGFSLGGNVLLKWLGEQGDRVPREVVAAAGVSVPFDLARGSRHLERGVSRVYSRTFLRSLKAKAAAKVAQFPDLPVRLGEAMTSRTLWEFDDAMTAPLHGFRDAAQYYARSSSLGYLARVRRPSLLLSAVDDPFLPASVLDDVRAVARGNPALRLEFPERGGHVGFVSGARRGEPFYYAEWRAMSFLAAQLDHRPQPLAVGSPR
ncbi:MAG: alpha/beta fold hydrolase [Gemmatimonadetes bacterium]|nr:alpha/beta fold hydrolase [Gemmatimonadota bacterium]